MKKSLFCKSILMVLMTFLMSGSLVAKEWLPLHAMVNGQMVLVRLPGDNEQSYADTEVAVYDANTDRLLFKRAVNTHGRVHFAVPAGHNRLHIVATDKNGQQGSVTVTPRRSVTMQ